MIVLVFVSNVFVDPETLPSWLERVVDLNPITHLTTAVRELMNGDVPAANRLVAHVLRGPRRGLRSADDAAVPDEGVRRYATRPARYVARGVPRHDIMAHPQSR